MKISSSNNLHKLVLLLILFFLVLVSMNGSMGEDEGRFSYIGRVWVENDLPPYIGTVENKTPGIFILNAISYVLFGTNVFFMRTIGILSILLTSLLISKIARNLHSREAGIFTMTIFGLTMSWRAMDGCFASHTETFMILFIVSTFFIIVQYKDSQYWRYWILLAGISLGFAVAFKQIAIPSGFAVVIFFILYNKSNLNNKNLLIGVGIIIFGALFSTFISIIPLLISKVSFINYINGAWFLLLDDGSTPSLIKRFISFRHLWFDSKLVLFYPFLSLIIFQSYLLKKKYFIGLLIWSIFDFIGANASGYYFAHQIKQIIPSFSLVIGIILANLIQSHFKDDFSITLSVKRFLIIIIILFLPYNLLIDNFFRLKSNTNINKQMEVGLWLKENSNKDDYVFLLCNANIILSYSERVSSNKNFCPIFINTSEEFEEVYLDLINKTPKFIIRRKFNIWNFPGKIEEFVEQNYSLNNIQYNFLIYKRNSS